MIEYKDARFLAPGERREEMPIVAEFLAQLVMVFGPDIRLIEAREGEYEWSQLTSKR